MKNLQELLNSKGYNLLVDGIAGPKTLACTEEYVLNEIDKRKWLRPINDFVWLRLDDKLTNTLDDICVRFKGKHVDKVFPCSTTAGDFYIFNPLTVGGITGTAVACEQQVLNSHLFTTAKDWKTLWLGGPYFQQVRAISFYRDGNKDRILDKGKVYKDLIGLNFHHCGTEQFINNWSASCLVSHPSDWYSSLDIFNASQLSTLTLIETYT